MLKLNRADVDALIFDMDGTMVDDMDLHKQAWREYLHQYGLSIDEKEFFTQAAGRTPTETIHNITGKTFSPEEVEKMAHDKEKIFRSIAAKTGLKEVAGLTNLLQSAKEHGIKLAMATSAQKPNREFILSILHLENVFDVIVGPEDISHGKPDPEIFLKARDQLRVQSERCYVFEDALAGIEAAKAAHMHSIGILTTQTREELGIADECLPDFTSITIAG